MKKILFAVFTIILYTSSYTQVINVVKTNGETQQYNLSDINNITFTSMMSDDGQPLVQNNIIIYTHTQQIGMFISAVDSMYFNENGTIAFIQALNGLTQFNLSDLDSITFGTTVDSTIYITYNGVEVSVINPLESLGVSVQIDGADVIVTSTAGLSDIDYVLSGTTSNGTFKIYSDLKLNLHLNNLTLTNNDGPAINVQSSKKITVDIVDGTTNSLSDAVTYATPPNSEDQDAAFFSEGQLIFIGNGTLNINAHGSDQHAIKSDDYIQINSGNIVVNNSVKDGINVNDGFFMYGGSINIVSSGDGVDADESVIEIYDGSVTILSSSNDKSALKADSLISISGGNFVITVNGDQSKGINTNGNVVISGGTFQFNTSGDAVLEASGSGYDPSYCTAIKADILVQIDSCDLTIITSGKGGRGISCDGTLNINSGIVHITSTGNGATYTNTTGTLDAYTGPCLKTDGHLNLYGGEVVLSHSGSGGKGISSDSKITIGTSESEPVLSVTTSGQRIFISTDNYAEAKAISADSMITIDNGNITITSVDDGIKSKTYVLVNDGTLNITQSIEGIEGPNIFVNGGSLSVNASDDGFNATYGSGGEFDDGSVLTFNGGYVYVNSTQGDAIDSNGDVNFNGGVIVVHGPQSAPEVGLDYNGTCKVTGGFLVISGTNSNMTQAPGNTSTQHSVLIKTTSSLNAGTLFHIEDAAGNSLLTFAPNRRYYSIVFSDDALVNGTSYRVYTGGTCTGTLQNGLYTGGTYSGGTLRKTFTLTSIVQTVTF